MSGFRYAVSPETKLHRDNVRARQRARSPRCSISAGTVVLNTYNAHKHACASRRKCTRARTPSVQVVEAERQRCQRNVTCASEKEQHTHTPLRYFAPFLSFNSFCFIPRFPCPSVMSYYQPHPSESTAPLYPGQQERPSGGGFPGNSSGTRYLTDRTYAFTRAFSAAHCALWSLVRFRLGSSHLLPP